MNYYYRSPMGKNVGPLDIATLKIHGITRDTLVWAEGMPSWVRAGDVSELSCLFQAAPPEYSANPGYGHPNTQHMGGPAGPQGYGQPNMGGGYGPQQPYSSYQQPNHSVRKPDNWLWLGICTTILCCLPLGIASIVYSTKVNSAWDQGDYKGAEEYANKAKMFGFIAAGVGILFNLVAFIFMMVA